VALNNRPSGVPDASLFIIADDTARGNGCTPPNPGDTVNTGCHFVLELWVDAGSNGGTGGPNNDGVTAAQSYLTFTNDLFEIVDSDVITTICTINQQVNAILSTLDASLQNEVCNSEVGGCVFRGVPVANGSIAYAGGALNNCPNGCPDPGRPFPQNTTPFRIADIGICTTKPGTAVLHFQFSPPAPATRVSRMRGVAPVNGMNPCVGGR
jgi:hypothetical protein